MILPAAHRYFLESAVLHRRALRALDGLTDFGTIVVDSLVCREGPWRELIAFLRSASTMQVKYETLLKSPMPRAGRPVEARATGQDV